MKLHGNARTCLHSRRLIVERVLAEGWTRSRVAALPPLARPDRLHTPTEPVR